MALEKLPRAGAGSVGGGSVRKAKLQDAGAVPTARVASDPGVNVPDLGAVARGVSDLGAGLEDFSQSIKDRNARLAAAEAKQNARRESVERIRATRELHDFSRDTLKDAKSSANLGTEEGATAYGAALDEKFTEIMGRNPALSPDGQLKLEAALLPIVQTFSDQGSVEGVNANDAMVTAESDRVIEELAGQVGLGSVSPDTAIAAGDEFIAREGDSFKPGAEDEFKAKLRAKAWGSKLDSYMRAGNFDAVEDAINMPNVRAAIGSDEQGKYLDRVFKAKAEKQAGQFRIMTPGELAAARFPAEEIAAGLVATIQSNGNVKVVYNPDANTDEDSRQKKIDAKVDVFERVQGMDHQAAVDRATGIVDGDIDVELTTDGVALLTNKLDNSVTEIALGSATPQAVAAPTETLSDIARRGNTAGIVGWGKSFITSTFGQLSDEFVFAEAEDDRQTVVGVLNEMVRAMSINPRFPVGEIKRLIEQINITPQILDSPGGLISRLGAIKRQMAIRLTNEENAGAEMNNPMEMRRDALQTAKDIRNFMAWIGDAGADAGAVTAAPKPLPEGLPEGATHTKNLKDGSEVWTDLNGEDWVVE